VAKRDETLGWGTLGFWFAVAAICLGALMFGVLVPSGTDQASNTTTQEPADRQQPAEQRLPTGGSNR
jgi:hypothetical protein